MRMIGSIPHDGDAERFSDYLVTRDIENMVEESASGSWDVWVEHDDDLDRAKIELDAFLKNPVEARYDAQAVAKKIRREEEKKAEKRRRQFIDYRTRWGQAKQWAAPVTITLIAVSMALSIGTNSIALGSRAIGPTGERQQRGIFGPPRLN